jgi:hypothetical protein
MSRDDRMIKIVFENVQGGPYDTLQKINPYINSSKTFIVGI